MFGFDLYDLQKTTDLPELLLKELSWSQGEENEFLSEGEFKGWPLRILPVFKKPFIRLNGNYYCFAIFSLFDNFYRVLQRLIIRLKPDYSTSWNEIQQQISESLPIEYFQKILPDSNTFQSVFYKWKIADNQKKQWCEVDGILTYDDHLFIIEVKAGAFTYTSPADDFPAHIESLKNLILKPAKQGKRFLSYLRSADKVPIFNSDQQKIDELSIGDFRHVTICTVSLDSFTELAAQVQHLKKIDIDVGEFPIWSISIDDLRAYSDIFTNPLIFLHYVEKRMKAFSTELIQTEDELDHLGLYIKHNDYVQYAEELNLDVESKLNFHGYHSKIDKFFSQKLFNKDLQSPLKQEIPERIREIVETLASGNKPGRSFVVSHLLNCNEEWREEVSTGIEKTLEKQKKLKRPFPFSIYGDINLTVFCWQPPLILRDKKNAFLHASSAMITAGHKERLLIELVYDTNDILIDIFWNSIGLNSLSDEELKKAEHKAEIIRKQRIEKIGKVGRNDPCPCGSGKKYKKCCLRK